MVGETTVENNRDAGIRFFRHRIVKKDRVVYQVLYYSASHHFLAIKLC